MGTRVFKIILVGGSDAGKTSLVRSHEDRVFTRETKSITGLDFSSKALNAEGVDEMLQIWNLADIRTSGASPTKENIGVDEAFKSLSHRLGAQRHIAPSTWQKRCST